MYKQLTIYVNDELVEMLTDVFFDFGALATTICDANEGSADEELIFDEPVGLLSVKQVPVWKHSINYDVNNKLQFFAYLATYGFRQGLSEF